MKNICISGIHTDAGKTCVSAALCNAFGYEYFKLVQAGSPTDNSFIKSLSNNIKTLNPGVSLKTAASPHVGIKLEENYYNGLEIKPPKKDSLLIELAGGLYCPLDLNNYMIDYISFYNLPTFLVSKNYLGSINHTILSIKALEQKNIQILGIIISGQGNNDTEIYLQEKFKYINFFFLENILDDLNKSTENLKNQILNSNIKDLL